MPERDVQRSFGLCSLNSLLITIDKNHPSGWFFLPILQWICSGALSIAFVTIEKQAKCTHFNSQQSVKVRLTQSQTCLKPTHKKSHPRPQHRMAFEGQRPFRRLCQRSVELLFFGRAGQGFHGG